MRQTSLQRRPARRTQPKRDWSLARAKVEDEGRCRACGRARWLQAAHVIGREVDRDAGYIVLAARVVPLCGRTIEGEEGCHAKYDRHELDLLPHLRLEEQIAAVRDAGGIEAARQRTTGQRWEP